MSEYNRPTYLPRSLFLFCDISSRTNDLRKIVQNKIVTNMTCDKSSKLKLCQITQVLTKKCDKSSIYIFWYISLLFCDIVYAKCDVTNRLITCVNIHWNIQTIQEDTHLFSFFLEFKHGRGHGQCLGAVPRRSSGR